MQCTVIFGVNLQTKQGIEDSKLYPWCATHMSTSGLCRRAEFRWNLGCYACRVLSPSRNTHGAPYCCYVKRHPQNRKHATYRNAVTEGKASHGLHRQCAQEIWKWSSTMWFSSYARGQTDIQRDILVSHRTASQHTGPTSRQECSCCWTRVAQPRFRRNFILIDIDRKYILTVSYAPGAKSAIYGLLCN